MAIFYFLRYFLGKFLLANKLLPYIDSCYQFLIRDQSVFITWGGPEEFVIVHI